jgi:hypothetical protein
MFRSLKNNFLNIRLRNLSDSNQAVVGIVVAVLLIGLVVTVLSVIQLIYVPNWMEEVESEHIDEVFNQFSQLKMVIDTQSAIKKPFTPIVTSINLGTNKIPFFMSTQAAGGLDIIPYNDVDDACIVQIVNGTSPEHIYTYRLGTIRFTSANAYYITPEQISFIYESGALITNQTSGNALNIKPSFGISSPGIIYFDLINISGVGGKISKSGYDIEHIRTEFYDNDTLIFQNVTYLNITTPHWDVWRPLIIDSLENPDMVAYPYDVSPDGVNIHFIGEILPDIELSYTIINAQIGPGWVDI